MNIAIQKSEELKDLIEQSLNLFQTIEEAQWDDKPLSNKWSKKELLGHLIDSAANNLRRFIIGQYEQGVHISYQQDEWVALQDYQHASASDLKLLWKLMNEQIIRVLRKMPESKLQYISVREKEDTLAYYIEDYIVHLNYHLNQFKPQHINERD